MKTWRLTQSLTVKCSYAYKTEAPRCDAMMFKPSSQVYFRQCGSMCGLVRQHTLFSWCSIKGDGEALYTKLYSETIPQKPCVWVRERPCKVTGVWIMNEGILPRTKYCTQPCCPLRKNTIKYKKSMIWPEFILGNDSRRSTAKGGVWEWVWDDWPSLSCQAGALNHILVEICGMMQRRPALKTTRRGNTALGETQIIPNLLAICFVKLF